MIGRGLLDRFAGGTAPAGPAAPAPAAPAGGGGGGIERPISGPAREARGDPITRLPEPAAVKFRRLRTRSAEVGVLLQDLEQRRMAAGEAKQRAEAYLDRCRHSRAAGNRMPGRSSYISGPSFGSLPPIPREGMEHVALPADDRQLADAEQSFADARNAF